MGGALLTVLCLVLLVTRVARTGTHTFLFLAFNLALAWLAYGLGCAAMGAWDRGARALAAVLAAGFWAMFPNAFYLVTDLIHVRRPQGPFWHDLVLLLTAAAAGTMLSLCSLRAVHTRATRSAGVLGGWLVVVALAASVGYGIWLGRAHRLNSWDVLVDPRRVAERAIAPILAPTDHLLAWGMTGLFGTLLLALYVAFMCHARALRPIAMPGCDSLL